MPITNPNKVKLLVLYNLLLEETDENHPMTTEGICNTLEEMDIPCDRRTLSRDIKQLNEIGYEVMDVSVGKKKGYYVYEKPFELAELKILLDAVQAAAFIPQDKTEKLTKKISAMGGSHKAELLQRNMVSFSTHKHSNENVYLCVDTIERAIHEKMKIVFNYFHRDENGEKDYCLTLDGDKKLYYVSPIAFIIDDNNYYLAAWSDEHETIRQYRIDRMDTVEFIDEKMPEHIIKEAEEAVKEMRNQIFHMYSGKHERVSLQFRKGVIGAVYDKFGEDTQIWKVDGEEEWFETIADVQLSPTFCGWVFQFGEGLRIVGPDKGIKWFAEYLETVKNIYNP